jgi:hypothetical protein
LTKRHLIEALREMPQIAPSRMNLLRKETLELVVRGALERPEGDAVRAAMIAALARAEARI